MRVLGIDPGLATVGIGLIEAADPYRMEAVDWCVIKTTPALSLPERLLEIITDLEALLDDMQPELVAVERLFFAVNEGSAIEVAEARGAILACLAARKLTILEPTPLQLKQAITGDGKADKRQIQEMVTRLLRLDGPPRPVDAADALALAIYGALQGHSESVVGTSR